MSFVLRVAYVLRGRSKHTPASCLATRKKSGLRCGSISKEAIRMYSRSQASCNSDCLCDAILQAGCPAGREWKEILRFDIGIGRTILRHLPATSAFLANAVHQLNLYIRWPAISEITERLGRNEGCSGQSRVHTTKNLEGHLRLQKAR